MQVTESTDDPPWLKPMGGITCSPKQRVTVAPQNGDIATTKNKKEIAVHQCKRSL